MIDLNTTREAYVAERPVYQQLASSVERSLRTAARRAGLHHVEFSSRTKDVTSFLRKALSGRYKDPLREITDKAGVRAVIAYLRELEAVEKLVSPRRFRLVERVDKRAALAEHEIGYLGLHLIISPTRGPFEGKLCEVQVRTRAEDVWSRLSHEALYKGPKILSAGERRRVVRLSALLEIFDSEADSTWERLLNAPDFVVARAIDALERCLYTVAGRTDGDLLTADIVRDILLPLYSVEELQKIDIVIDDFASAEKVKLREIYQNYRHDDQHLLLHRPEAIMIFERLTSDPFSLKERWLDHYPLTVLTALADVWGVSVDAA